MTSVFIADQNARVGTPETNTKNYWRAMLRLIALLLTIWFMISFGLGIVLVEPLNRYHLGGFPLGFWFAQQGSIYVFMLLVFIYAWLADRLAARYGVD